MPPRAKGSRPQPEPDEEFLQEMLDAQAASDSYTGPHRHVGPLPSDQYQRAPQTGAMARPRSAPIASGASPPAGQVSPEAGVVEYLFARLSFWLDVFMSWLQGRIEAVSQATAPLDVTSRPASAATHYIPASADTAFVTRASMVTELPLPPRLLDDPDLKRYFDQMKLYDYAITRGGLHGLTFREAVDYLARGRWGQEFQVRYSDLSFPSAQWSQELAYERYMGMLPVYKAQANTFPNTRALSRAIEEDIALFLRAGKGSEVFHKFFYK